MKIMLEQDTNKAFYVGKILMVQNRLNHPYLKLYHNFNLPKCDLDPKISY